MSDKPILFSAPMVRALLDGRKTQTRRVLNPQPNMLNGGKPLNDGRGSYSTGSGWKRYQFRRGDRLWVRETLRANDNDQGARWYGYAADGADVRPMTEWHKTRDSIPSIHMPRWASRLTLLVTDVRVQRLQNISEEDARADGVEPYSGMDPDCSGYLNYQNNSADGRWLSARGSFCTLWDSINAERDCGKYAWAANPWVMAVSFSVVKGNIDTLEQKP